MIIPRVRPSTLMPPPIQTYAIEEEKKEEDFISGNPNPRDDDINYENMVEFTKLPRLKDALSKENVERL